MVEWRDEEENTIESAGGAEGAKVAICNYDSGVGFGVGVGVGVGVLALLKIKLKAKINF